MYPLRHFSFNTQFKLLSTCSKTSSAVLDQGQILFKLPQITAEIAVLTTKMLQSDLVGDSQNAAW